MRLRRGAASSLGRTTGTRGAGTWTWTIWSHSSCRHVKYETSDTSDMIHVDLDNLESQLMIHRTRLIVTRVMDILLVNPQIGGDFRTERTKPSHD